MPSVIPLAVITALLCGALSADTLRSTLLRAQVPSAGVSAPDLDQEITSYAIDTGDPFLLAYYIDHGSGLLQFPLRVMRYSRATHVLKTVVLQNVTAPFSVMPSVQQACLGSADRITERNGNVYIETMTSPSAGCILILSTELSLKAALSGWVEGVIGADYLILHESEIHFMSIHPMRIAVFDLRRNLLTELYPPKSDTLREQYSSLIRAHMPSEQWCMQTNSACDPGEFDNDLGSSVAVNQSAKVFGFIVDFYPAGFGDAAAKSVPSQEVAYVFRLRNGAWQYREFLPAQLEKLFGTATIKNLVSQKPNDAFTLHY